MQTPFPDKFSLSPYGTKGQGTIFFLHANSYSAGLYKPFLDPLAAEYEIWAPDLPGHGNSRWTGTIQAWENLADYFIEQLGKTPPAPLIGMGHSIGAVVTMIMALKKPEWFSKLILLDPVLLPKHILWILRGLQLTALTHIVPLARAADRRKSLFPSRQAAFQHYSGKKVFSRWEPQFLEGYVDTCLHPLTSGAVQLSCAPQLESSIYQSLPLYAWSIPRKLQVPSLFLIGAHSDTVNQRGFRRLKNFRGNHIVKSVSGGHLFPFEKPAESMALIKDFLTT